MIAEKERIKILNLIMPSIVFIFLDPVPISTKKAVVNKEMEVKRFQEELVLLKKEMIILQRQHSSIHTRRQKAIASFLNWYKLWFFFLRDFFFVCGVFHLE